MKQIILTLVALIGAYAAYTLTSKTDETDSEQQSITQSPPEADVIEATKQDPTNSDALANLVSKAPSNAKVYIIEPTNGATVSSPITVKFGIENMVLAKAGDNQENSGHHHLLINLDQLPDMSGPLPATEQIVHFGGAQTETEIELAPGEHTLQLLLGNYLHIPHDKPVLSEKISIMIK